MVAGSIPVRGAMIVALIVDEDNDLGYYVRQQKECVPGTSLLICHDDMWSCWTYIAKDQEDLDAYVASLNAEFEEDDEEDYE